MPKGLCGFQKGNKLGNKFTKGHQPTNRNHFKKGHIPWNKGKPFPQMIGNIYRKGKGLSVHNPFYGKKHTKEEKIKAVNTRIKNNSYIAWNKGKSMPEIRGENHWNWKGGKTKLRVALYHRLEYKQWRKAVFERDTFTCVNCDIRNKNGLGKTVGLEAHHIIPFVECMQLEWKEAIFDVDNGETLCVDCHNAPNLHGGISHAKW